MTEKSVTDDPAAPAGGRSTEAPAFDVDALVDDLLAGEHRALARAITYIEDRTPGYRELVGALHDHTGDASVVGITGSPGTGKSTLVDKLALEYRDRGHTVGVIAVDPASPFTGGAVLGDRIRMGSTVGDMDVFVRSMSARGALGGLAAATADAVRALDAFGKDRIIIETVGAGQNEIDVVRTADTVAVLVQPGAGDDVQMLKAGILEIADCFVVNKADLDGANRTVQELTEMLQLERDVDPVVRTGHHGVPEADGSTDGEGEEPTADEGDAAAAGDADDATTWRTPVVETIATKGEGVDAVIEAFDDHHEHLEATGALEERARMRYAEEIRTLLREDLGALLEDEIDRRGGIESLAEAVHDRETDPYSVADDLLGPIEDCVEEQRSE
ncbi:lao/ao transporter ATPase [Salinarchaeum sp. Harcht-Bsk1]|uniref:methylmalonyl Co-A mutase-associated GTPase MeaB n=1 Tax=Salinarchaeum sp. Harcht-Bsk1 TaxID=1333523 RepID=UPI0003422EFB|nr:methylmalonyl Co-A mutase-associated GTPase MeaB [Salinarchaeum sp. Harcht-Bsk1]AGN02523.1 lao/ao transporter ATPase [Salinarchaeum sp. Harcht-Bsk1]